MLRCSWLSLVRVSPGTLCVPLSSGCRLVHAKASAEGDLEQAPVIILGPGDDDGSSGPSTPGYKVGCHATEGGSAASSSRFTIRSARSTESYDKDWASFENISVGDGGEGTARKGFNRFSAQDFRAERLSAAMADYDKRFQAWGRGVTVRATQGAEDSREKWRRANDQFDDWFNELCWDLRDNWKQGRVDLKEQYRNFSVRLRESLSKNTSEKKSVPPAVDMPAAIFLGLGSGGIISGQPILCGMGSMLAAWGIGRAVSRVVVRHVDGGDADSLFRLAPAPLYRRREAIYHRLCREVHSWRKIRTEGVNHAYMDGHQNATAMHPELDYTPEKLFDDTSVAITKHARVNELLGGGIKATQVPDKVVYRIFEGISEVYLGWHVAGSRGGAEVQVKATASILDYIYIFPDETGRYGMGGKPGLVIRPNGNWWMSTEDMPIDQKQPFGRRTTFGEKGGGYTPWRAREGVFDYDWDIREFRHGREGRQYPGQGV